MRLAQCVGPQARNDKDPEVCLTTVMTKLKVSRRSDLDAEKLEKEE